MIYLDFVGLYLGGGGGWMATEIVQILAHSILLYNGAGGV
jgi:CRISPR/Cas system CSM-associated protein Csm5 (group 7 of RAMP superfamily)